MITKRQAGELKLWMSQVEQCALMNDAEGLTRARAKVVELLDVLTESEPTTVLIDTDEGPVAYGI